MGTVLAVVIVVLVAATGQTIAGFGFGLLAVPPLALVLDPRAAVVVAGLAGLVLSSTTTVRERAHVRWTAAGWLLGACLVGMPFGILVLRAAPVRVLTGLIGACVLGGVVIVWRGVRLRDPGRPVLALVGLVSGVLTTATGTSGPPLVAAFHAMGYPPRVMRATVAALFTVTGVASVVAFAAGGLVTAPVVGYAVIAVPAVLLGWWLGQMVFVRIDRERFRTVILVALVVSGLVTLVRALG